MGKIKKNILISGQEALNHYGDDADAEYQKRVTGKAVVEQKNQSIKGGNEQSSGAVGTIRVIFDGESPKVEIKSSKGWIQSDSSSATGFIIKK